MTPRLSGAQRSCLTAASIEPLVKTHAGWGHPGGLINFHTQVVHSLRDRFLLRINQVRKRHFQAVITDLGEAAIAHELATARIPHPPVTLCKIQAEAV